MISGVDIDALDEGNDFLEDHEINDTGYSEVNMITGDEYYKTYGDEFGETGLPEDKHFYEDYGQKYNTRQFFKHDFNNEVTKFMGGIK